MPKSSFARLRLAKRNDASCDGILFKFLVRNSN